jgi:ribosomal protein S18 acetylase RimI-like enzyme
MGTVLAISTRLPAGLALRAPTAADADAVAALLRARDRADVGRGEVTTGDVLADWAAPGVDLGQDAWILEDADGGLLGYGLLTGSDLQVAVDPECGGRGLGTGLRRAAEQQAQARGARVLRQFVPTCATAARTLLLEAGWWPVHHYFGMQIALDQAPDPPDVLARTFEPEHDTEALWHLLQGAYSDVEGHLPQSLELWRATGIDKPGWDPGFWILLHDGKGIIGAALGEKCEPDSTQSGVVTAVAVAHRARGMGHGRTLLLLLLDAFRREELRVVETAAHGPTTAAARLFESVGMKTASQSERWEKVVGA